MTEHKFNQEFDPTITNDFTKLDIKNSSKDQIISNWQETGPEFRNNIIRKLNLVSNPATINNISSVLMNRYELADDNEKRDILLALGNLGGGDLGNETMNSEFLISQLNDPQNKDDRFRPSAIIAIDTKVSHILYHLSSSDKNEEKYNMQPVILKLSDELFKSLSSSEDADGVKSLIINGLPALCRAYPELKDRAIKSLRYLVENGSSTISPEAFDFYAGLADPDDEFATQRLINKYPVEDLALLNGNERVTLANRLKKIHNHQTKYLIDALSALADDPNDNIPNVTRIMIQESREKFEQKE